MQKVEAIKASGCAHMILCTCTSRVALTASEISLFSHSVGDAEASFQPCCTIGDRAFLYFPFLSVGPLLP